MNVISMKRIFQYLLFGILITWSIVSYILIFHVMGIDQIYTKIRITRALGSMKDSKYSQPVFVFKGRITATSKNEINLAAIKNHLENEVREELNNLFKERPYVIVEQMPSGMNLECYKGIIVNFYVTDSLRPEVTLEQAYDKVKVFLNKKLDETFAIEKDFFESLPEVALKNNQLYFLTPNANIKLPESIRVNEVDILLHRDALHSLFRCYVDNWSVEYKYPSTKLTGFNENQSSNKKTILQIPVKDSQGEIYQILVRLK